MRKIMMITAAADD